MTFFSYCISHLVGIPRGKFYLHPKALIIDKDIELSESFAVLNLRYT